MPPHLYHLLYGPGSLNRKLFLLINHASTPFLDVVMPAVTFLGGARLFYLYLALLLAVSLLKREWIPLRYVAVFAISFFLCWGVEEFLKDFFQVPRPAKALGLDQVRVLGELKLKNALPSGHAILAFMAAQTLGYRRSWHWNAPLLLFALMVCYSRIYVGAHYPLDVLAGGAVGAGCGFLVWKSWELAQRLGPSPAITPPPPDESPPAARPGR